jgi:nitroreductase
VTECGTITREQVLENLKASGADSADWAAVSQLLLQRYSCRAFRPDPVAKAPLAEIFAVAQFSANWCNAQAWQVIVTEGEATDRFRQALTALVADPPAGSRPDIAFPVKYEGAFAQRRRDAGLALYQSAGITREDKAGALQQMQENYRLFGAPHVAIVTTEADLGTYGAVDCGIYLANLMALMQARGLASIAQGALPRFSEQIRAFFDIPDNRHVLCALSFGFADDTAPVNQFRTTRAEVDQAVRWVSE